MTLISYVNFEWLCRVFSKNVCSARTNLGLLLYPLNKFQCKRGMVSNG